jgi:anti-sigma-K factor RskA
MIDDRQEELASLHAFGLLEGPELEQFTAELERSPELRQRVAEFRIAATALAHTAPEAVPPEALKARILASAAARSGAKARTPGDPAAATGKVAPFPSWIPWLAAACIGAAALFTQHRYSAARAENASLGEETRVALASLDEARTQLADAKRQVAEYSRQVADLSTKLKSEGDLAHYKIATLASMLGNTPAAVAVAVWDPSRAEGVLEVSKLPALATAKDYELWVIDAKYPTPVSAGVFVVDPVTGDAHIVFKASKPVHSIAKFAVSLERKGGAATPEGPIVLISH